MKNLVILKKICHFFKRSRSNPHTGAYPGRTKRYFDAILTILAKKLRFFKRSRSNPHTGAYPGRTFRGANSLLTLFQSPITQNRKFNYSIPDLILIPNFSILQASKPRVASAGITKWNQFGKKPKNRKQMFFMICSQFERPESECVKNLRKSTKANEFCEKKKSST